MFRPRIIPVLLLQNKALVKSVQFRKHVYIGDPINAVRIFNSLRADELFFLDIDAGRENRTIAAEMIRDIGEEADMPFAAGGGIRSTDDIRRVLQAGAEKAVIGTQAAVHPSFIREAADTFGSSSIAVCIDVRKSVWGKEHVWVSNGRRKTPYTPVAFARLMEEMGAGELIVQSVAKDGMMTGYDVELLRRISGAVTVPVVALGGAGKMEHLQEAYDKAWLSGLAAGSLFVYMDGNKGVLINYPGRITTR